MSNNPYALSSGTPLVAMADPFGNPANSFLVGSSATTTSIPLTGLNSETFNLSSAIQSQFVGGTIQITLSGVICYAKINSITSSGVLTLDSALPTAPASGAQVIVVFPSESSLTGSNNTVGKVIIQDALSDPIYTAKQLSDSDGGNGLGVANFVFNGSTWDRVRNNTQGTLLASAARTATTTSPVTTNYNSSKLIVYVNVTAASGTGGLNVIIRRPNLSSVTPEGDFVLLSSTVNITGIGKFAYGIFAGASGAGNLTQVANIPLTRQFYIEINPADSSSYTYEVTYDIIN